MSTNDAVAVVIIADAIVAIEHERSLFATSLISKTDSVFSFSIFCIMDEMLTKRVQVLFNSTTNKLIKHKQPLTRAFDHIYLN